MKKKLKILIIVFLYIVIITITFFYIKKNSEIFFKLFDKGYTSILIILFLTLINLFLNSIILKQSLGLFNLKIKLTKCLGLILIKRFANLIFSKSGTIFNITYLKKNYNFPYKNIFSLLLVNSVIQTYIILFLLIVFIAIKINFLYILLIFLLFLPLFFTKQFKKIKLLNKYLSHLNSNAFSKKQNYSIIYNISILFLLTALIYGLKIKILFSFFSQQIEYTSALVISNIGLLSSFVPITPSAIGIKELLMSYSAKLINENFTITSIVAITDRLSIMLFIIIFGIIYTIYFHKFVKNKIT